jgi:AraC family transcriptional regulator
MRTIDREISAGQFVFREQHYGKRFALPWHEHPRAELCFLVEGSLREECRTGPLEYSRFAMTMKPGAIHHRLGSGPSGARCLVVTFPTGLLPEAFGSGAPRVFGSESLTHLGLRALSELRQPDPFSALALEGVGLELLAHGARKTADARDVGAQWLERARECLHDEAGPPPALGVLALRVGVPATTLAQAFRRRFGCSVGTYVRRLRVERAVHLLRQDDLPLAEIAHRCGFFDQSHFTRVFRAAHGVPPGLFRQMRSRRRPGSQ